MTTVNIVPFDNTIHRSQVMAVWRMSFGYETAHNEPGLVIDKKLAMQDGLFFVAVLAGDSAGDVAGEVVGTVMAGYDGHRGWLYSVAVSPGHRKLGAGRQLVAHAEQALVSRGCLKINLQLLQSNAAVATFYASMGYAVEPRVNMGKLVRENIPVPGLARI
jgi:ribosomal protein S18 acetylase RimI-like enzyme